MCRNTQKKNSKSKNKQKVKALKYIALETSQSTDDGTRQVAAAKLEATMRWPGHGRLKGGTIQ